MASLADAHMVSTSTSPISLCEPSTDNNTRIIPLTRTPEGWQIFEMVFKASLGPNLRISLEAGLTQEASGYLPTDVQQKALFSLIHDRLVTQLRNEHDLL